MKIINTKFSVFGSKDYKNYYDYCDAVRNLLKDDAYLIKQEKTLKISNFLDTFDWIIGEAKKGYSIQRYKGLGEMNPSQLWETTMDPEVRTLIQVTIPDAIAADHMFSMLMGDEVPPRRAFIEHHAL